MNYDPNTGQPINNNFQQPAQQGNSTNGFAIAGLIVSIFVSALIGLILSIVGLAKSKSLGSGKGLSIAGIIVAIIKMIIEVILCILLFGVMAGLFGVVTNKAEYCPKATCGTVNSSGYANCEYIDGDGIKYEFTCPKEFINSKKETTTKTTKTTNTTSNLSGALELKITDKDNDIYYADKFYLTADGELYAKPTKNAKTTSKYDSKTINGDVVYKIIYNVKKAFVVEAGQAGYQYLIIVDKTNQAYRVINMTTDKDDKEFYFVEIKNGKNIDKVYSLLGYDAVVAVYVNTSGQLVPTDDGYIEIDKKNGIYENKVGSDVIKAEYVRKESKDSKTVIYFNIYVNGKKLDKEVSIDFYDDLQSYDDTELVTIPITWK